MASAREGFTLVEAVMVLALAGLLVLGGVHAVGAILPRIHLRAGTWEVTSALNQARFRAIMSGEPVRVRFVAAGFLLEHRDDGAAAWTLLRAIHVEGVTIRANNAPVFHPQGTVSDLATVTVSNAKGSYRITVAITGRIRTSRAG